jgi:hypothetical protein
MYKKKLTGGPSLKEDSAALHPELQDIDGPDYYRACAVLRNELKALIARHLTIKHDLFLLSNTTQGVMTVMAGLASEGIALRIASNAYPPYAALPSWPHVSNMAGASLQTHVDPVSGNVAVVVAGEGTPSVLDAAQSFATVCHHQASLRADVFLCSLHKHAGICAGLGLLAIRKELPAHGLRKYAEVAESGACSRLLLEHALARARLLDGRLANVMILGVDEDDRSALADAGIDVLTPGEARLPFVSLRGVDTALAARAFVSVGLHVKAFGKQNVVRVSGAIRGAIDDAPVDCTPMLKRAISILTGKTL